MEQPQTETSVTFDALERLDFPSYFTASFDYMATGEGRTVAILMGYAASVEALREKIEKKFGSYFGRGAYIWQGIQIPDQIESYLPDVVKRLCAQAEQDNAGHFEYFSSFHLNFS